MNQLVNHHDQNQTLNFSVMDNEKLFNKNKKLLGLDWEYANKPIVYRHNELGFRNKPFNQVNWKESIVIIGCSNVRGMGLAEDDMVSSQLEKILNIPVINLGICGSGIDMACWNSLIIHENYSHPRALVQIWSSLDRYTDYDKKSNMYNTDGPWLRPQFNILDWASRSEFYRRTDRALWKNNTIYYEASFFEHTATTMNIDQFNYIDNARDLAHPGSKSVKVAAERIAKNLKQQGI